MSDTTTHLGLPYLLAAQAQKHVTHNEALRLLDALVQLSVVNRTRTAPPTSPADGNRYLVAAGATGLWAGWDTNIAFWIDGAWLRLVPRHGWRTWVEAEGVMLVYDDGGWTSLGGGSGTPGEAGADGASAYAIWLAQGNTGTEADFLAALVGPAGAQGPAGSQGLAGPPGANGATGPAGPTGNTGAAGPQGPTGSQGPAGPAGADGTSVTILGALALTTDLPGAGNSPGDGYIIAGDLHVWDGSQWNNVGPITGPQGDPGTDGVDGVDGADGVDGTDGASAYQIWLSAGNTGTVGDFLAALAGAAGPPGSAGPAGPQGPVGAAGVDGADGSDGTGGADGADGTDGTGFLWRGAWVAGSDHAAQDVVGNGGSSYVCTVAHVSDAATAPGVGASWTTRWAVIAAKGATGDLTAQGMIGSGPAVLSRRPVNGQSASYALALSDEGASLHMTGATATTVTVPTNSTVSLPLGAEIEIVALGVGTVTIAAATGVILNGVPAGSTTIAGRYQGAVLRKYGGDTWLLMGAVGAVT